MLGFNVAFKGVNNIIFKIRHVSQNKTLKFELTTDEIIQTFFNNYQSIDSGCEKRHGM